tara:strand:- start:71319 stop:71615 length:297 start_codon:yes stop_codon:yes gene_type:complete
MVPGGFTSSIKVKRPLVSSLVNLKVCLSPITFTCFPSPLLTIFGSRGLSPFPSFEEKCANAGSEASAAADRALLYKNTFLFILCLFGFVNKLRITLIT